MRDTLSYELRDSIATITMDDVGQPLCGRLGRNEVSAAAMQVSYV